MALSNYGYIFQPFYVYVNFSLKKIADNFTIILKVVW